LYFCFLFFYFYFFYFLFFVFFFFFFFFFILFLFLAAGRHRGGGGHAGGFQLECPIEIGVSADQATAQEGQQFGGGHQAMACGQRTRSA
jgi:hypothetical protein